MRKVALVMMVALLFYTLAFSAVVFEDSRLESTIRDILGKAAGETIAPEEMAMIARVDVGRINSLVGLEYCINLTVLKSNSGNISSLEPLRGMKRLEELWLMYNRVSDLEPLSGCVALQKMILTQNRILDISPLRNLKNLQSLDIDENFFLIENLSALLDLPKLKTLEIQKTAHNDPETIRILIERGVRVTQ